MNAVWVLAFCCSCVAHAYTPTQPSPSDTDFVRFVDPFIGTAERNVEGAPPGDVGGAVFPGAAVPFGMIQWSPDTTPGAEFGYRYEDAHIKGFTVNHLSGPGCAALLDFPFLPITRVPQRSPALDRETYAAGFSHDDERATPGYYAVRLASGIQVELTADTRAARARITYPKGAAAGLLVEAAKSAGDRAPVSAGKIEAKTLNTLNATLSSAQFCGREAGYQVHLAAAFDHDFVETGTYRADAWEPGARERDGAGAGVYVRFDTERSATVGVTIAISYVSPQNARENLEAALAETSFDKMRAKARNTWNRALGRIEARGGTPQALRTFYSALYHTLLHPNVFSDVNGEYMGLDKQVHTANGYTHYANYSGWDIYRSWIQLIALIAPQEAADIVRSLVIAAQQCGGLPRWTLASAESGVMVGDPSALIIANAWAFGVRGFDAKAAFALMAQGASLQGSRCQGYEVRPARNDYNQLGYLPADTSDAVWGPTSTTLEYAVADFAIGRFAKEQGLQLGSEPFLERSRNWRNLYNPQTGYIQPRLRSGEWTTEFDPSSAQSYVEGNAAQYTFFVPHDVVGLAEAMGGNAAAVTRLDDLFAQFNAGVGKPHFYIGNEPGFGTPWLYNYLGTSWKTQAVLRNILGSAFSDRPDGLPGNDDLGALSSFVVWAHLGLYPDVPGVGGFALSSPVFPWVRVNLPSGKRLEIAASDASDDRFYVQSVELDGKQWDSPWLPFDKIERGAQLSFELDEQPEPRWGRTPPPRHVAP